MGRGFRPSVCYFPVQKPNPDFSTSAVVGSDATDRAISTRSRDPHGRQRKRGGVPAQCHKGECRFLLEFKENPTLTDFGDYVVSRGLTDSVFPYFYCLLSRYCFVLYGAPGDRMAAVRRHVTVHVSVAEDRSFRVRFAGVCERATQTPAAHFTRHSVSVQTYGRLIRKLYFSGMKKRNGRRRVGTKKRPTKISPA